MLEALRAFLCAGAIEDRGSRRAGWSAESRLTIASERSHLASTIPFGERFLPACHKRDQFERWRGDLLVYRRTRPWRPAVD